MFISIRSKILATYLLLTLLGMTILSAFLLHEFREFFIRGSARDLMHRVEVVADSIAGSLAEGDLEAVRTSTLRYGSFSPITVRVFNAEGRIVAVSRDIPLPELPLDGMEDAMRGIPSSGLTRGVGPEDERLYAIVPVFHEGEQIGAVRMSLLLRDFELTLRRVRNMVLGGLALALAICCVIGIMLARGLAGPIHAMSVFAERIGGGGFGEQLALKRNDEIGILSRSLNRMSWQLAEHERQWQEFLAAASHELRTPVSNMRVTLESLLDGAAEDPEMRDRFLGAALGECQRLSRLINGFMDLARLEAGKTRLSLAPVALAELLDGALVALEPRLEERGLRLERDFAPELTANCDADRFTQVLMNLLENAIRYTPPETTITVHGRRRGRDVEIEISDEGPGIPPEDLPHVFERFYTVDKSRTRTGSSGTGLGLAIAKQIVEAHGGSITASSEAERGATFTIRLPAGRQARAVSRPRASA